MNFPNDFWELIVALIILVTGAVIYKISTRNRGSFTDTPDWSKVVRRVVELVCVFVCILLFSYLGWNDHWYMSLLMVGLPIIGVLATPTLVIGSNLFAKGKKTTATENLNEHFANALILAFFLLSGVMVILITLVKNIENVGINVSYLFIALVLFLSSQFAFLSYQLYYLIVVKNVPGENAIQIIKICEELNE